MIIEAIETISCDKLKKNCQYILSVRLLVKSTTVRSDQRVVFTKCFVLVSLLFFTDNILVQFFFHFQVENKIKYIGCYVFFLVLLAKAAKWVIKYI